MKEVFSKKYNKWFLLKDTNKHPRHPKLFRFGKFYYRPDKDMLIHEDIVDEYIDNLLQYVKDIKKSYRLSKLEKVNKKDSDDFFNI